MKKIFLLAIGFSINLLAYNGGTYEGNIKGCAEGNARACNDLAGMYLSGRSHPVRVKEDKEKAKLYYGKSIELYSKYCDEGNGEACFNLAEIYNGMKWGIKQDYTMMLKYHTKSCENNYGRGCNEVGAFYKRGQGTKRDKKKSEEYYKKAIILYEEECDGDIVKSCDNLALIYRLGMYGTNNEVRGKELEQKAFRLYSDLCEKKDDEGCLQMATYHYTGNMVSVDWKKAKVYYEKSCKYGQDSACWRGRDINISKQFEHEKKMAIGRLWGKYAAMEEQERKASEDRRERQMEEINDTDKTMAERRALLEKVKVENVLWDKEYEKRIKAIKKALEDEKKVIEARIN